MTRLLVPTVILALTATPILAQDVDPRVDAPVQLGPLYLTPALQLSRLGVDTNVFNTRGERQSDYTVVGGPTLDIALPLRRFILTTETQTDFVYYHRFENQRGINLDLAARGELRLSRLSLFVEQSYLDTRQRPNFEIDVRARRREKGGRVGITARLSRKLDAELSAGESTIAYAGDDVVGALLAERLNREGLGATASLRYALTPLTTIRVRGDSQDETFVLSPGRNHRSWSVRPGVEFGSRALIAGTAEVGYRQIRGRDASLPDFNGVVASVDLTYRLLASTRIRVLTSRDIEFSFSEVDPYYVAQGVGLSVRHQLTPGYAVRVGTRRMVSRYRETVGARPVGVPSGRQETMRRLTLTVYRRLTRDTEIGFDVSHESRRSTHASTRDFDGLLAGITMGYAF